MNKREIERKRRIDELIVIIRENNIEWDKFLNEIMYRFGVAKRTAQEYISVAKSQV